MIHFVAKGAGENSGPLDLLRGAVLVEASDSGMKRSWNWRTKSRNAKAAFIFALRTAPVNPLRVDHDDESAVLLSSGRVGDKNSEGNSDLWCCESDA